MKRPLGALASEGPPELFCEVITVKFVHGIAYGQGERRATGWTARIRFPAEARNLSLLHSVQNGPGIHPAPLPGTLFSWGSSFRGVKLTTHFLLVPSSRMLELYLHSPTCLHGIVLS
jgi:hypothetical protein